MLNQIVKSSHNHIIGYCDRCGRRFSEGGGKTRDHIIPRHGFGCPHKIVSSPSNIQYICVMCQRIKSVLENWTKKRFYDGHHTNSNKKNAYFIFLNIQK